MRDDTFGKNALLFGCRRDTFKGTDAPAFPATLRGWRDTTANDGATIAMRANDASIDGIVVPVTQEELKEADRANAAAGRKRAIAMVEIEGGRTWAFLYTQAA